MAIEWAGMAREGREGQAQHMADEGDHVPIRLLSLGAPAEEQRECVDPGSGKVIGCQKRKGFPSKASVRKPSFAFPKINNQHNLTIQ